MRPDYKKALIGLMKILDKVEERRDREGKFNKKDRSWMSLKSL